MQTRTIELILASKRTQSTVVRHAGMVAMSMVVGAKAKCFVTTLRMLWFAYLVKNKQT